MRALYQQVAKAGTFLVLATRLGGLHGYDEAGAVAPMGGADRASRGPEARAGEPARRLISKRSALRPKRRAS